MTRTEYMKAYHLKHRDDPGRREAKNARGRAYYLAHRDDPGYKVNAKAHYTGNRVWMRDVKAAAGCKHCSEREPICLDFHHRIPEEKSFTIGMCMSKSREVLLAEAAKCDILCSNCHRKVTHGKRLPDSEEGSGCEGPSGVVGVNVRPGRGWSVVL